MSPLAKVRHLLLLQQFYKEGVFHVPSDLPVARGHHQPFAMDLPVVPLGQQKGASFHAARLHAEKDRPQDSIVLI